MRVVAISLCLLLATLASCQQLQTGVVHENVICQHDPSQSYALYLPKAYTPDKRWPIIYVFDPFARGGLPLELMRAAAERAGFIVAASNNSRNGPIKDSIGAAQAVWADTHRRFALDEKQRYATGLSGGARAAATVAQLCGNCLAGVVAQGAGFHPSWPPSKKTQFVLFGTAGNLDFNYIEMVELDKKLEEFEVTHRLRVFAGGHQYAPAEIWDEVFAWLKLQAMRRGIRPRNPAFVEETLKQDQARAAAFEAQGDLLQALREYRALMADLSGLTDVAVSQQKLAQLEQSKAVKEALKSEREAIARQKQNFKEAITGLDAARDNPEKAPAALSQVRAQLALLRAAVNKSKDINAPEIIPVRRTLVHILSQAIEMGEQAIRDQEYALAITYFDLAIDYARAAPLAHFDKARALALSKRNDAVLPALRKAVETGFDDPGMLESATEFAAFREKPEFRDLVVEARKKHGN